MRELQSFRAYLELERRRSPHTVIAYGQDIEQFFRFVLETYDIRRPDKVSPPMVRAWVVSLMEEERSPATIRRKISTLNAFYRFLQKRTGLAAQPARGAVLPRKARRLPSVVPAPAMAEVIAGLPAEDSYPAVRDRMIIQLLYQTGLRRAELLGLDEERFDLDGRQVRILGKRSKERLVPFGEDLASLVREYLVIRKAEGPLERGTLFLTDTGRPMTARSLYDLVRRILSGTGQTEKRSPHVLRHTFATHLAESGADLQAIRSMLGHQSLASTQVYTHTQLARLKTIYRQAHPRSQDLRKDGRQSS